MGERAGLFTAPSGAVFLLCRDGHLHALWDEGKTWQLCCFEEVAERDRPAVRRWLDSAPVSGATGGER